MGIPYLSILLLLGIALTINGAYAQVTHEFEPLEEIFYDTRSGPESNSAFKMTVQPGFGVCSQGVCGWTSQAERQISVKLERIRTLGEEDLGKLIIQSNDFATIERVEHTNCVESTDPNPIFTCDITVHDVDDDPNTYLVYVRPQGVEGQVIRMTFALDFVFPPYSNNVIRFDMPIVDRTNDQGGGGCLIATAAFGTELAPHVQLLREVRNNAVFGTGSGAAFLTTFNSIYYSFSPTIADWERQNPIFKETVKIAIIPMLSTLSILNYVDIDSDQEMLGYGIGIILLNIGIYFVVPALVIIKLRTKFNEKIWV